MSRLRILWLKTGPLHPLDTGGKLRTFHMLRELTRDHHVTFMALAPEDADAAALRSAADYSQEQIWVPWRDAPRRSIRGIAAAAWNALFSPLPFSIEKYRSTAMAKAIAEHDRSGRHDVIVCDFLTPALNLFPCTESNPQAPTLLFEHNVESLIWERLARNARSPLARWYFAGQSQRMNRFEQENCRRCSGVVAVSEEDAAMLRSRFELPNVLGSVPTGVDTEYFAALEPRPEPANLVFLGSMDWMPNIDAVLWFHEAIWPRIKSELAGVRLQIVGRRPSPAVQALAADPAITVTGTVPDVRPHLSQAELMIVPLRIGGGTRIKIYEAMAAGVPVLSTMIGAEGLSIQDGENILLADAPEHFARETVRLLTDPTLRLRLGTAGQRLVVEHFGWPTVTREFVRYCREVAA